MIFDSKLRAFGNSHRVIIPVEVLRYLNIKEGDLLDLKVEKGTIIFNKRDGVTNENSKRQK